MIHGVDVSGSQNPARCDYSGAAADGARFAFVKLTEGRDYVSKSAADHARGWAAAGVPFGFYHYCTPSTAVGDAHREAQHFILTARSWPAAQLLPVLDVETKAAGQSWSELSSWVAVCAELVAREFGGVLLYGGKYLRHLVDGFGVERYPVWLSLYRTSAPADFDDAPEKMVPVGGPWGRTLPAVWQWSSSGRVAGLPTPVDLNVTADLDALRAPR